MAVYTNTQARALGLNHSAGQMPRLVGPGADFVAAPSEIPQSYVTLGYVKLVSADEPAPVVEPVVEEPAKGKSK